MCWRKASCTAQTTALKRDCIIDVKTVPSWLLFDPRSWWLANHVILLLLDGTRPAMMLRRFEGFDLRTRAHPPRTCALARVIARIAPRTRDGSAPEVVRRESLRWKAPFCTASMPRSSCRGRGEDPVSAGRFQLARRIPWVALKDVDVVLGVEVGKEVHEGNLFTSYLTNHIDLYILYLAIYNYNQFVNIPLPSKAIKNG